MAPQASPLAQQVYQRLRRLLGATPPRHVAVQLGPSPTIDYGRTTAGDLSPLRRQASAVLDFSAIEQDRLARYRDYREAAEEEPELYRALEVFVDFIFGDAEGFEVGFSPNVRPEVQRLVEAAESDLDLQATTRGMVHEGMWLGDSFTELLYALDPPRLAGQRPLQADRVRAMIGDDGLLQHYEVVREGGEPRILLPYQVIHYAPGAVRGATYGRSLFHAARGLRRQHEALNHVLSMLGLRRAAGDVYWLWPMPEGSDPTENAEWIKRNQDSVDHDAFFDRRGWLRRRVASLLETAPKILQYRVPISDDGTPHDIRPSAVEMRPADLAQLVEALRYFQDRFFIATGVPKFLVGLERDVNSRATSEQQALHFAMSVRNRQRDAARLATDMLTRALLAAGVIPEPDEFWVMLPEVSAFDAQMRASVQQVLSQAVVNLVNAGVPLRFALQHTLAYEEDELDELLAGQPMVVQGAAEEAVRWVFSRLSELKMESRTLPLEQPAP